MRGFTLDRLTPYNACVVESAEDCGASGRLADFGLTPGTELTWLFAAPCGDPTAYLVRGAAISIRRKDAERIRVLPAERSNE